MTEQLTAADLRARHEKFVDESIAKFTALLADIRTRLLDLTPSAISEHGFHVGDVRVAYGYHPSYGFSVSRARRAPDRIEVTYTERPRPYRTRRKTLTYTAIDGKFTAKLEQRVRAVVAELERMRGLRAEVEARETEQRLAQEARRAPLEAEVEAFNSITGTSRFHAVISDRNVGLQLLVSVRDAGDVTAVLQALLQVVIKDGGK
jgi:hypothetical protein